jgi:hypothetical protein
VVLLVPETVVVDVPLDGVAPFMGGGIGSSPVLTQRLSIVKFIGTVEQVIHDPDSQPDIGSSPPSAGTRAPACFFATPATFFVARPVPLRSTSETALATSAGAGFRCSEALLEAEPEVGRAVAVGYGMLIATLGPSGPFETDTCVLLTICEAFRAFFAILVVAILGADRRSGLPPRADPWRAACLGADAGAGAGVDGVR